MVAGWPEPVMIRSRAAAGTSPYGAYGHGFDSLQFRCVCPYPADVRLGLLCESNR